MMGTYEPGSAPDDFHILPITARQRELLLRHWESSAETLMNRDGDNPKYINGGHRIRSNPLLTAAIEEIRDAYFDLFNQKHKLLLQREKAWKIDPTNKDWDTRLNDVDYDLVTLSHDSYNRLQQPNYGFTQGRKVEILATSLERVSDDPYQLDKTDAAKIVGTIIKRSINAFEIQFKPRVCVPHVPPRFAPVATKLSRSRPRPEGNGEVRWQQYIEKTPPSANESGKTSPGGPPSDSGPLLV